MLMKRIFLLMLALMLMLGSSALMEGKKEAVELGTPVKATITIKNMGDIRLELYPKLAPQTVANFVELANSGFYNGLIFHRVIRDFMIQGGCPDGIGTGGPGYTIRGEFKSNGFENPLKHERGAISMARTNVPDSAGSQFFICHKDSFFLDGHYAVFGKVTEGMDIVDKIASVKRDSSDRPVEPVEIEKISVDAEGVELPKLEKIEEKN